MKIIKHSFVNLSKQFCRLLDVSKYKRLRFDKVTDFFFIGIFLCISSLASVSWYCIDKPSNANFVRVDTISHRVIVVMSACQTQGVSPCLSSHRVSLSLSLYVTYVNPSITHACCAADRHEQSMLPKINHLMRAMSSSGWPTISSRSVKKIWLPCSRPAKQTGGVCLL